MQECKVSNQIFIPIAYRNGKGSTLRLEYPVLEIFQEKILSIIRPSPKLVYRIHKPKRLSMLTHLRVDSVS